MQLFITTATLVLLLLTLVQEAKSKGASTAANEITGRANNEITAVLDMQAAAWNDGDLDKFMTGYLQSPDTSYTSGGKEVWGYEALRKRYQDKYGDDKKSMGHLTFANLRVFDLGAKNALCIGNWDLKRTTAANLKGTFSLVLVKADKTWKIIHDHSSVADQN